MYLRRGAWAVYNSSAAAAAAARTSDVSWSVVTGVEDSNTSRSMASTRGVMARRISLPVGQKMQPHTLVSTRHVESSVPGQRRSAGEPESAVLAARALRLSPAAELRLRVCPPQPAPTPPPLATNRSPTDPCHRTAPVRSPAAKRHYHYPFLRSALLSALLLLLAAAPTPQLAEVHTMADVLRTFREQSRVRVVNVWATWCAPCVAEIGDLQTIATDFRGKGVEVVGISLDDALPGDRAASKTK